MNRASLDGIFSDTVVARKQRRDRAIRMAEEKCGYSQKEVAHHLKMHYSTISRLLRTEISRLKT